MLEKHKQTLKKDKGCYKESQCMIGFDLGHIRVTIVTHLS